MRRACLILLLLVPVAAMGAEKKDKKNAKKALAALKEADKLAYRPLEHGLKDIRLEFKVVTKVGTLTALWLHREANPKKKLVRRDRMTVTNVTDRKLRRRYAAGLKAYFRAVTYPVLLDPFIDQADGMKAEWEKERGGKTVLRKPKGSRARFDRIWFVWGKDLMPREISWLQILEDEEEGEYKVERVATYEWKSDGRYKVVSLMNSDYYDVRCVAKYTYKRKKKILLPSKVEWINPFDAPQMFELKNLKVNEGISDEEFSKWR